MALLSVPRCSLPWFVFARDKNTFLWAAELDLESLPVCHSCQLKDTYQLRACGRTIIFQTDLRVKRTWRKSKSRVCKSRWSKGESMAAINVEKDGKRAPRDPVWEFSDATCARACVCAYTYAHISRCLCVLYKRPVLTKANREECLWNLIYFCWSQSHNCINCWAKRPWCRFPWCGVTQRWRSDYCSVFYF